MKSRLTLPLLLMGLIFLCGADRADGLQATEPQSQLPSCPIAPKVTTNEADRAMARGQFADADRLFAAMPPSDETLIGQVRAKLGEGERSAALNLASHGVADHPQSALLMDGLAEVRFNRGEVVETLTDLRKALAADPCLARAHYDLSLYLLLSGMAGSAQKELDIAYRLAPNNVIIRRAWKATQEPVPTPDSQIADLQKIESRPDETAQQKTEIESVIQTLRADKKGDCELASSTANASIPLVPIYADGKQMPPTSSAVELVLNGKKRMLLLDTGETGITISREAAADLGLTPEAQVASSGIGDNGASAEFIAHLDRLKIGTLEFRNCKVRVQTQQGLSFPGLFGLDTLRSLLITVDFPRQEIRTAALPDLKNNVVEAAPSQTIAASSRDRYVPPGMEDWTPAFRASQNLMLPTSIGNVPQKLFILDTGAGDGLIATEVAREVTQLTSSPGDSIRGSSGVTNKVATTGPIMVTLPGDKGQAVKMTALDLSRFTLESGVEVSGFVGYNILRHLIVGIDYRDNLVHLSRATDSR